MARVETVEYPAWWAGATTVRVTTADQGASYLAGVGDVELLPQGVSLDVSGSYTLIVPWANVRDLVKVS